MNRFISFTKWALGATAIIALVFIYSCNGDDDDPIDEPVEGLVFTYAPTTVEVGETGTILADEQQGDPATFSITDAGGADFVTVNQGTGELTVDAESTTGLYSVEVTASNDGGDTKAIAEITISVNADFDLTGKNLIWKYWMNNTPDVIMVNLNMLPGQEALEDTIPLTTGWPADWPNINLMDPMLPAYFVFPTVQYFLMQVPGDDACAALDPAEDADTLLLMVNNDLSLSTTCRGIDSAPGTVVLLGTSSISYSEGAFTWTLELTLQGVPVTIAVGGAVIEDFTDAMDPHWEAPSGVPRTFSAVTGNVAQYMTPTNFDPEKYLESIQLLDVDVVFEILEEE